MRTIKFRGKDQAGIWHFGDLLHGENAIFIDNTYSEILGLISPTKVLTETVGQFIGLHDDNDCEIYDGDILQDDDDLKIVVFWNEMYMEWAYRRIDTGQTFAFAMLTQALRHFTVVGNIHDNPELLKKEV